MEEYKLVHFNLFEPHSPMFKQSKNKKAEVQTISCNNSDNCGLLKRGECSFRMSFRSNRCMYGRYSRYVGFSQRASKYYSWNSEQKKKHEGIGFLKVPSDMMAIVGDYIFLPYAHMDMLEQISWEGPFIKKEDFTVENIIKLLHFRPQALFGGEIKSYQKETPPSFLKHLSEQMPYLFRQVIESDEQSKKRFSEYTNIGRKAALETTTPNIGEFGDIHGGLWKWDGKALHSTNSHASFMLVKKFKELTLIPEEKQEVVITDERQVNKDTVFVSG